MYVAYPELALPAQFPSLIFAGALHHQRSKRDEGAQQHHFDLPRGQTLGRPMDADTLIFIGVAPIMISGAKLTGYPGVFFYEWTTIFGHNGFL